MVADAYFSKASFLNPLLAEGITVISRLRKDAVGWDAPVPVVGQCRRGRPRKQGRVWKLATLLQVEPVTALTVRIYGKEERLQVVWRDVWVRDVAHQVRVVVVATEPSPSCCRAPTSPCRQRPSSSSMRRGFRWSWPSEI